MFICIRKIHVRLFALSLFCVLGLSAVLLAGYRKPSHPVFAAREGIPVTVVIDPGHGGEDGGAGSSGGVEESRINLAVALRVNDLLRFVGQHTRMTRTEDVSIHDEDAATARQKKVSDLKNRVNIVNGTENAILLSIHQNSLPSSAVTHGAQVFWNRQEGAEPLALSMQEVLNAVVNTHRSKQAKAIPDTIYLMKKSLAPGILVECGFLSNADETRLLQDAAYQQKMAGAITVGLLRRLAGEDIK